jgi:hypothetical protein
VAATLAALLPVLASAAETDAADAAVPVPPTVYRSAFAGVPAGVEQDLVDWKQANTLVGQFPRGHADLLKWEQAQPPATPQPESAPRQEPRR